MPTLSGVDDTIRARYTRRDDHRGREIEKEKISKNRGAGPRTVVLSVHEAYCPKYTVLLHSCSRICPHFAGGRNVYIRLLRYTRTTVCAQCSIGRRAI